MRYLLCEDEKGNAKGYELAEIEPASRFSLREGESRNE
jgi:hypothetical protein